MERDPIRILPVPLGVCRADEFPEIGAPISEQDRLLMAW
jgi:hypothetical protein